ncbi:MAG: peptidoglycan DD-metalloendopeptidase family protein [Acetatifactor sp.]
MENNKRKNKFLNYTHIKFTLITLFVCLLFLQGKMQEEPVYEMVYYVSLNGEEVGVIEQPEQAEDMLRKARRNVSSLREGLTFMEADLSVKGRQVTEKVIDDERQVVSRMEQVLYESIQTTLNLSYTVKVQEYMVNLASKEEVKQLLQTAIDQYDGENRFEVDLVQDTNREFNLLTTQVYKLEKEPEVSTGKNMEAGVQEVLNAVGELDEDQMEKGFDDFHYGKQYMDFAEKVEIVEAYLPMNQLTPVEVATEQVIKEQEVPSLYEVVAGDTLTRISKKVEIPMDKIVEMNSDLLKDINSTIHIGDMLKITVPEPELSVVWAEQRYYEEEYEADVIYIDNDSWYTTKTVVQQQPSSGYRKIAAEESYLNGRMVSKTILKEEIVKEAVPMIIERGTKTPPTYIKPITGGRITSGYGSRKAPVAGATTNHRAIDWYVPTGTAVFASCGGSVSFAGWMGSYGNVIFINHEDGRQTRYAHLSKILVKKGDYVKQGQKIGLSGATGNVSGPHLHFEMKIDGVSVNPLLYLDK